MKILLSVLFIFTLVACGGGGDDSADSGSETGGSGGGSTGGGGIVNPADEAVIDQYLTITELRKNISSTTFSYQLHIPEGSEYYVKVVHGSTNSASIGGSRDTGYAFVNSNEPKEITLDNGTYSIGLTLENPFEYEGHTRTALEPEPKYYWKTITIRGDTEQKLNMFSNPSQGNLINRSNSGNYFDGIQSNSLNGSHVVIISEFSHLLKITEPLTKTSVSAHYTATNLWVESLFTDENCGVNINGYSEQQIGSTNFNVYDVEGNFIRQFTHDETAFSYDCGNGIYDFNDFIVKGFPNSDYIYVQWSEWNAVNNAFDVWAKVENIQGDTLLTTKLSQAQELTSLGNLNRFRPYATPLAFENGILQLLLVDRATKNKPYFQMVTISDGTIEVFSGEEKIATLRFSIAEFNEYYEILTRSSPDFGVDYANHAYYFDKNLQLIDKITYQIESGSPFDASYQEYKKTGKFPVRFDTNSLGFVTADSPQITKIDTYYPDRDTGDTYTGSWTTFDSYIAENYSYLNELPDSSANTSPVSEACIFAASLEEFISFYPWISNTVSPGWYSYCTTTITNVKPDSVNDQLVVNYEVLTKEYPTTIKYSIDYLSEDNELVDHEWKVDEDDVTIDSTSLEPLSEEEITIIFDKERNPSAFSLSAINSKAESLESEFRTGDFPIATKPIASPGGGSGGGSADCSGDYVDPGYNDIQIGVQCQAAWNHCVAGVTEGVSASCAILDGYQQLDPSSNAKSKCSYCAGY